MRLFFQLLIVGLMAAAPAMAQSPAAMQAVTEAPVIALDARGEERLAAGESIRVIVQFDLPPLAFDGLDREARDALDVESIGREADDILQGKFGSSPEQMSEPSILRPRHVRTFRYTPAFVLEANRAQLEQLAADPRIVRIRPDGLDRVELTNSTLEIGSNELNRWGYGGSGATIAVLDTGIDYNHPAFTGRIIASACFSTNNENDTAVSLCQGDATQDTTSPNAARACNFGPSNSECDHGTHVASIAAGAAGTHPELGQYGFVGVAPEANLVPIQVFSRFDDSELCGGLYCVRSYHSDQIAALEWLYDNRTSLGLSVVNMSLGGEVFTSNCLIDTRTSVIRRLLSAGVATVVASGNDGRSDGVSAPACIPETVAVSSGGNQISGNTGPLVDLSAPGNTIRAAANTEHRRLTSVSSGTSMATPHVAGAFAIMMAALPDRSVSEILTGLRQTGRPQTARGGNVIPFLQLIAAYQELFENTITIEPPASLRVSRQYNLPYDGGPLVYRFTNTSAAIQPWTVEFSLGFGFEVSFTGGNATFTPHGPQTTYTGELQPGETMVMRLDPSPAFGVFFPQLIRFIGGGQVLLNAIAIEVTYPAPANDDLADARAIRGHPFFIEQVYGAATYEPGEAGANQQSGSVWFAWTPGVSGPLEIESRYSIELYTGSMSDIESLVPAGDWSTGGLHKVISLQADADETYLLRVLSTPNSSGETRIRLNSQQADSFPGGQSIADAVELTGASGHVTYARNFLRSSPTQPGDLGYQSEEHLQTWFTWTAPYSGDFVVSDQATPVSVDTEMNSVSIYRRQNSSAAAEGPVAAADLELLDAAVLPVGEETTLQRALRVSVQEGETYWIRIGSIHWDRNVEFGYGPVDQASTRIFSSALPSRRTTTVGDPVTAFMSVANPVALNYDARNCRLEPVTSIRYLGTRANNFSYQATDSLNRPIGTPNERFDLPSGETATFLIVFDPAAADRKDLVILTICDNVLPFYPDRFATAAFSLTTQDRPSADVIAVAATPTGDGVLRVGNDGASAFSVAAVNFGNAGGDIVVTADLLEFDGVTQPNVSLTFELCETNSSTGQCLAPRQTSVRTRFESGDVKTFSVFVRAENAPAYFSPADFRLGIDFSEDPFDSNQLEPRGATSVAIRTLGD